MAELIVLTNLNYILLNFVETCIIVIRKIKFYQVIFFSYKAIYLLLKFGSAKFCWNWKYILFRLRLTLGKMELHLKIVTEDVLF